MPWWAFLTARSDLDFLAERHSFSAAIDSATAKRIHEAVDRSNDYAEARLAAPMEPERVKNSLHSAGFVRELTPEQLRNVCKLAGMPAGATFSVPGAGKTTEALALYALKRTPRTKLLVTAPKNAFAAWEEQLNECLPKETQFVRLTGGQDQIHRILAMSPDRLLIGYQQLNVVLDVIADFLGLQESFVFLDESHRIKLGLEGAIGGAVLSIAHIPASKLILSGTPMPNSISDLVPQFQFLFPEVAADEENIQDRITPIYVRTTKAELKLPPIVPKTVPVPLRQAQHELYQLLRSEAARHANQSLKAADRIRLRRAGQSVLRLLQVVSNPGLLAAVEFDHPDLLSAVLGEGDSPKLEVACLRARQLAREGRKTIIWSTFVSNVELIANRLMDLGADYIHGGVDAGSEEEEGTRENKIQRFHDDPQCMVLVANPAACGEGISLHTVCHHAIYVDRNYNAAQYLQSQDRIHRIGVRPDQITTVEILYSPGTVDDSVERRLTAKVQHMADVLNDHSLHVEPEQVDLDLDGFNLEDLSDLLRHIRRQDE